MTKMILVRHCQAQGNLERFFQGTIDTDITPLGREQINKVALLLKDEPIDVIISSSKKRARLTAEGINAYHGLELITDDRIVEINAGLWEGVTLTEISQRFPEQFENWKFHPERFCAPEGESMAQVYDRVRDAITDIVSVNRDKTICVVSHGCAIKNMMCFLHGFELERIGEVPLGTNTSVNVIMFDDDLKPLVVTENYSEHLK